MRRVAFALLLIVGCDGGPTDAEVGRKVMIGYMNEGNQGLVDDPDRGQKPSQIRYARNLEHKALGDGSTEIKGRLEMMTKAGAWEPVDYTLIVKAGKFVRLTMPPPR